MDFEYLNTFSIWNISDLIDCLNIAKISLDKFWGLWFFDWAVHYINVLLLVNIHKENL